MNKLFLTSALLGMFVLPTCATTVTGIGTECTQPILNTDTGPATLQAQWNANTINLSWYDDNTAITPSNNAAGTCTYDEGIILPTNTMTKEGYTFAGWQVRIRNFFEDYNISTNGTAYYARSLYDGSNYCYANGSNSNCSNAYFNDIDNEWKTEFDYGTVKGVHSCNSSVPSSTFNMFTNSYVYNNDARPANTFEATNTGSNCWCRVTSFAKKTNGVTENPKDTSFTLWVGAKLQGASVNNASCGRQCGMFCARALSESDTARSVYYGLNQ